MHPYVRDAVATNGLRLLTAAAEKDPRIAEAVKALSEPGILWNGDPRNLNAALVLVLGVVAASITKVDTRTIELEPYSTALPVSEEKPPAGPPSGSALDENYLESYRRGKIRTPVAQSWQARLGRALTAEEHDRAKQTEERLYGSGVAEVQKPSAQSDPRKWGIEPDSK